MPTNNVTALFDQQCGFSTWKESYSFMHRFQSDPENLEQPLLDTPIFACKSALKQGNEHIVSMANEDGKLIVLDCESKERASFTAHNNAIFDLAWMFDQMKLVTASGDHTSKLYDLGNGDVQEIRMFCGHSRSVKTVTFQKDDSSVFATGSRDGNIVLWDTRTEQNSFIGKAEKTIVNAHIGGDVVTPSKHKKKYTTCNSGTKSVTGLVFQDSNTLISCSAGDGIIKIWDLRKHYSFMKKEPLPKHTIPYIGKTAKKGFSNLLIDRAGVKLYANCLDNTIYCYNVASYNPEPVMTYRGHQNNTFYIKSSLCKNENYLVSGSSDEHAYIWNLKYSDPIIKLIGHTAEVTCVAWCNSKSVPALITCSDDMTHRVWTIYNENCLDNLRGRAEVLPLPQMSKPLRKRLLPLRHWSAPKRWIGQCQNCHILVYNGCSNVDFCENCMQPSLKRKADCNLWNESKRVGTEFGPRRLFGQLDDNFQQEQNLDQEEEEINLKSLDKALGRLDSTKAFEHDNDTIPSSPTVNLPNFVLDGKAPHLTYSPPKRKSHDWLTKMRMERNLRQEMLERTAGPSSPKSPRLELTPKSGKKSRTTLKNPLLRYFKVTTNKNDNLSCSPKSHSCNFFNTEGMSQ